MSDVFVVGRRPDSNGHWTSVRIKDISTYVNRGVAPTYADEDTGLVAFSQKCVLGNGSVDVTLGRPMVDGGEALTEARLGPGDVVVNSTGTGTLGRVGTIPRRTVDNDAVLIADGHVTVIRAHDEFVIPEFLAYLLGNSWFMRIANDCLAVGSTNQMELGREAIRTLGVRIPTLGEQERIVAFLDAETERIDKTLLEQRRLVALTQERFRAIRSTTIRGLLYSNGSVALRHLAPIIHATS